MATNKQTAAKNPVKEVKRETAQALDSEWLEKLMRFGYISRGILYIVLGLVAAGVVLGARSQPKDPLGAIAELAGQPYGKFLLVIMAIGLTGYAFWGVIRAIWNPLHQPHDAKGYATRAGYLWSALTYGSLVLPTVQFLQGKPTTSQGQTAQTQDLTARLLQQPWGKWVLLLLGIAVIIGGLYQIYYAYRRQFERDLNFKKLKGDQRTWMERLGEWGYAARGVIFMLIGYFFTQAALTLDPKKAQGLDGALGSLSHQGYGPLLLGLVALGLVAFGLYSVFASRYARVDVENAR